MLNSESAVAGTGEYDPAGNVNRVTTDQEISEPQLDPGAVVPFATIHQPDISGFYLDIRPRVMAFDADCNGNGGLKGGVTLQTPGWSWWWSFCTLGNYWFPWAPQNGGGTVSVYANSGQSPTFWGAVVDAYEYRRYQPGVTPFWTPLRYPGQYHDEWTDLDQNQNRFYDPMIQRYLEPEPLWQSPFAALAGAYTGTQWPVYGYAANNPVNFVDRNGLEPLYPLGWPGDAHENANAMGEAAKYAAEGLGVVAATAATDGLIDLAGAGLWDLAARYPWLAPTITAMAGQASSSGNGMCTVSRWGRPGLQPGDWVMRGPATLSNYFWSGKWQPGGGNQFAPPWVGEEFEVLESQVSAAPVDTPLGRFGAAVKNALGQSQWNPF